ncbi:MAG: YggT family protein [Candidatus Dojkabacteria bacterium]|nr:MAG: YggT family protein [Candidatus Dojkabacteria bacterium]
MFLQIVFQILYVIVIILESLLSIRFVLKLLGANANVGIISWLYNLTETILSPLRGVIMDEVTLWGITIELTTLLVIFILTLIAYALFEIIKALE